MVEKFSKFSKEKINKELKRGIIMGKLGGIFPALITPFTENGKINIEVLKKLVSINIEKGVDGFYVGGSTAEAFLLTPEERKTILEAVAEEVKNTDNDEVAIISHIGCISTDQAIELAEHAETIGVDAISSIPPFYYNFSLEEIKGYYFDIVDNVDVPMIIYNFPSNSGVTFDSDNARDLLLDERIIGVKHTSYDLYQMERFKEIDNDLIIFNGRDEVFLAGLAMGADGAIGSTYNFMAEKFIKIRELYNEGELEEAREIQKEANDIIDVVGEIGVNPAIKYILKEQGLDCGECRKPFKRLGQNEIDMINNILA